MNSTEIVVTIIPSLLAIVAVWVNLNRALEKLKGRNIRVESDTDELKQTMKEAIDAVHQNESMHPNQ